MANMELIEAKTLASSAGSITFSAIPQTYTDLKILVSARDDRDGQPNTDLSLRVGYNGTINTGSIYTNYQLYGNGSSTGSQSSSTTYAYLGMSNGPTSTANTFGNTEIYILNYTSANNKSVSTDGVSENNATLAFAVLNSNIINTSNPITDIQISAVYGSGNFLAGSTFYLYGISNATSTTKATGGIVSSDGVYNYHMFPFSGTFTPTESISNVDYLVIAGGGGGGVASGGGAGGGGAGGLRSTVTATGGGGTIESKLSLTAQAYTVTVGAGGVTSQSAGQRGGSGSNSVFSTITSTGGGFGGAPDYGTGYKDGGPGGSGGGGGLYNTAGGAATPSGQGYAGGASVQDAGGVQAGGGGGAGAVGTTGRGTGPVLGAGGAGLQLTAFSTSTNTGASGYYAGGGGGGANAGSAAGGAGGGGTAGSAGTANTGGGGGGAGNFNGNTAGAGGSGIVIVRYAV